jgi:hypothetical protein
VEEDGGTTAEELDFGVALEPGFTALELDFAEEEEDVGVVVLTEMAVTLTPLQRTSST